MGPRAVMGITPSTDDNRLVAPLVRDQPSRRRAPGRRGDDEPARRREPGDDRDRRPRSRRVRDDPGEYGAEGEAGVAPEAVDADGRGAIARLNGVGDGGNEGRIDERGPDAEEGRRGHGRPERAAAEASRREPSGLDEHAEHDQRLSPGVIGEPPGGELAGAPERRVHAATIPISRALAPLAAR